MKVNHQDCRSSRRQTQLSKEHLSAPNLEAVLSRCVEMYITKSYMDNISMYHDGHSAPSTPAEMTSGDLLHSIIAFPLISVTERRLKSWLVGSLSSHPFFLARACPMRLTTPVATLWKPPRVSTARGKNCSPWVLQASAVSLIFLS